MGDAGGRSEWEEREVEAFVPPVLSLPLQVWQVGSLVGRLLRWVPEIPTSWYSCPCVILSAQAWAGSSDLLLTNRKWRKL